MEPHHLMIKGLARTRSFANDMVLPKLFEAQLEMCLHFWFVFWRESCLQTYSFWRCDMFSSLPVAGAQKQTQTKNQAIVTSKLQTIEKRNELMSDFFSSVVCSVFVLYIFYEKDLLCLLGRVKRLCSFVSVSFTFV